MNPIARVAGLALILISQTIYVFAEEIDPLKHQLIVAEGEADLAVAVNQFKISFDFDVERATFDEARMYSKRVIERMGMVLKELNIPQTKIVEGWDLIKESKISFGTKGRRLSNSVTLTVDDVPAGKLHEYLSKTIDAVLAVDAAIVLDQIDVDITDSLERAKKQEVLGKAVSALETNASKIAQSLGRKILAPKRVFASSGESLQAADKPAAYSSSYSSSSYYSEAGISHKKPLFRKGFRVRGQVVDHIYLTANVVGVYEIE